MKKNKIIHIISGLKQGGAENILYNLISHSREKYEPIVISLSTNGFYFNKIKNENIKIYEINFSKKINFFFNVYRLIKIIKIVNPIIIQTWMYHANFISIFIKIFFIKKPLIWNIRNSNLSFSQSKKLTIFITFISSLFSYFIPNYIISCSKRISDYHISIGYNKKIFINIENGFNSKLFYYNERWKEKYRKFLNIDDKTKLIGFINRYDKQKNFDVFFEILTSLKKDNYKFKAILCGENINKSNKDLIKKIKYYHLSEYIILAGARKKINYLYSALDYSVSTSLYGEGFQNTLLESIATETLPLYSKAGDAKFILNKIIDTFRGDMQNDYVNFIYKIEKLNVNEKSKIINSLKALSKNYTLEKMCLKYMNIYGKFSNN